MNISALIEKIKAVLKNISGVKTAEPTPTAKSQNTTKPVKSSAKMNNAKKKTAAAKSTPTKERKQKTSTGDKEQ